MRYFAPTDVEFYRVLTAKIGEEINENHMGYGPYTAISAAKATGTRETRPWRAQPRTKWYVVQKLEAFIVDGEAKLGWTTVYSSEEK